MISWSSGRCYLCPACALPSPTQKDLVTHKPSLLSTTQERITKNKSTATHLLAYQLHHVLAAQVLPHAVTGEHQEAVPRAQLRAGAQGGGGGSKSDLPGWACREGRGDGKGVLPGWACREEGGRGKGMCWAEDTCGLASISMGHQRQLMFA